MHRQIKRLILGCGALTLMFACANYGFSQPALNSATGNPPGLSLNVVQAGSGDFVLVLRGSGFTSNSVVWLGTTALTTTFTDSTSLFALVPSSILKTTGTLAVTVLDGNTASNSLDLSITYRGDANANGAVSIGDALVIARSVATGLIPPVSSSFGDVNLSDAINIGDALVTALFVGGTRSNFQTPAITSANNSAPATPGGSMTITGNGFSSTASYNVVFFSKTGGGVVSATATAITGSGPKTLTVTVPISAVSGPVFVKRRDLGLPGQPFVIAVSGSAAPVYISNISPAVSVVAGTTQITITGSGFDSIASNNIVRFSTSSGTVNATPSAASATSLTVRAPATAASGFVSVTTGAATSNRKSILVSSTATPLSVNQYYYAEASNEPILIEGTGFNAATPGDNQVLFTDANGNDLAGVVIAAGRTELIALVPPGAATGALKVKTISSGTVSTPITYTAAAIDAASAPQLVKVFGDGQTGEAGTQLSQELIVEARDSNGNPVPGIGVTFFADGSASVSVTSVQLTGADGRVQVRGTLGSQAGTQIFTASASGLSSVAFSETATLTASRIDAVSGNGQAASTGTALASSLRVRITNDARVPVPGVTVTWASVSGGGLVSPTQSSTDANGEAQTTATLGSLEGTDVFTATRAGLTGSPIQFTATAQRSTDISKILFVDPDTTSTLSEIVVAEGGTAPVQVRILDNGANVRSDVAVSYSSSNPDVATVNASGTVLGRRVGFSTLTVTGGGVVSTATIAVVQITAASSTTDTNAVGMDPSRRLYLASSQNHTILFEEDLTRTPTIYAGRNQTPGFQNGIRLESLFRNPAFLAFNQSDGMLYVSDSANHVIRRVRPGTDGAVETFAGTGVQGSQDGPAASATFNNPQGIAFDGVGNLWVVDGDNHTIRRINLQTRIVDTVAGQARNPGYIDGTGAQALFNSPRGIALEVVSLPSYVDRLSQGEPPAIVRMLVADAGNNVIRRITSTGAVETVLSTNPADQASSVLARISFASPTLPITSPTGIAVDSFGNIYVTETSTNLVKSILPSGKVVLAAPRNLFNQPKGLAVSDDGKIIVTSASASAQAITFGRPEIALVTPDSVSDTGGARVNVFGKNFAPGTVVVAGGVLAADVTIVNTENLYFTAPASPSGLGTLTIANRGGIAQKAFTVTPASLSALQPGYITTVAGGSTFIGDGGDASQAEIRQPGSVSVAANGDLYIADSEHFSVRRVDSKTGVITTVAGNGRAPGDATGTSTNVSATATELAVKTTALDAAGNLVAAGGLFHDTFKVDAVSGLITAFGERSTDFVAFDGDGNLFYKKSPPFAEMILKRTAGTGNIVAAAGGGAPTDGVGDNLLATQAAFAGIAGLAVDSDGNVFITDTIQNRIRRVDKLTGIITTVTGTGSPIFSGDNGPAVSAGLEHPAGLALNASGDFYFVEASGRIRRVDGKTHVISTIIQIAYSPKNLAVDGADNLYVPSEDGRSVLRIDGRTRTVRPIVGRPDRQIDEGTPAVRARLLSPADITIDGAGDLLIMDSGDRRVRKVTSANGLINTIAGNGGRAPFVPPPDGATASDASLNQPRLIATDASNNVLFVDWGSGLQEQIIWRVDKVTGHLQRAFTFAGSSNLTGLATGATGGVFYTTDGENRVFMAASGTPTPVAGAGQFGYSGDGGPATLASLAQPLKPRIAGTDLYFPEYQSSSVRKVNTSGIIATVAGGPGRGFPNTSDVAVDADGNVYILATNGILQVDAQSGIITTVAYREYGVHAPLGDNGPAINAGLGASAIAVDAAGNLFIADDANNRIRAVRRPPAPPAHAVPSGCIAITANQATNGSLSVTDYRSQNRTSSYADCYTFSANAGDKISITINAAFDPYLYLLNSSGQVVASSSAPVNHAGRLPDRGSLILPRTGTYIIEATGYSSASLGTYSLTLTGTPLPTIASIDPSSALAGSTATVTIRGTNFTSSSTVAMSGTGVSVSAVSFIDSSSLTVTFSFSTAAAPGPRTVTLTTSAGTSLPVTFNVIPRPPVLTSVLPNASPAGRNVTVALVGTGFVAGATTVLVSGSGVSLASVNVTSGERADATLILDSSAPLGSRNLTVTTAGGTSNSVSFTVQPRGSTLSSINPAAAAAGSSITMTLTGGTFVAGSTTVAISGGGITIGAVNVSSATSMTVNLSIALAAATGTRTVTVTTPDGPSNTLSFTITAPPAPTCTPINYGQTINASLSATDNGSQLRVGSFSDCYTFPGQAGDRVVVTLTAPSFDGYVYLIDGKHQIVTSATGRIARIPGADELVLPSTGVFTLEATSSFLAATGDYTLSLASIRSSASVIVRVIRPAASGSVPRTAASTSVRVVLPQASAAQTRTTASEVIRVNRPATAVAAPRTAASEIIRINRPAPAATTQPRTSASLIVRIIKPAATTTSTRSVASVIARVIVAANTSGVSGSIFENAPDRNPPDPTHDLWRRPPNPQNGNRPAFAVLMTHSRLYVRRRDWENPGYLKPFLFTKEEQ